MKIAIVHDDLIQHGGAEKLLLAFTQIFPDAPVYTLVASERWQQICKEKNIKLHTSFMQKLPFAEKLNRYYAPFLFHILGMESFDLGKYDVVLSSSTRFAHGVVTKETAKHICYMNSPGRMFWEPDSYFEKESYGFLRPIKFLARPFLLLPLMWIRIWDFVAAQRVDEFIANSKLPKERIKKYYKKSSKVIYPFVEYEKLKNLEAVDRDYFVILTRLASWKKVEIAIEACKQLNLNLKIIGDGPARKRLEKLGNENIEFLGRTDDRERNEVLRKCKALIQTQKEDFGIVPLEAMACGKPVIALGEGGAKETVVNGVTGVFFEKQTKESLIKVLEDFDASSFDSNNCRKRASQFSEEIFKNSIKEFVLKSI